MNADSYMLRYASPSPTRWLRTETLADDFVTVFSHLLGDPGLGDRVAFGRANETYPPYVRDHRHHFTANDLARLYERNPVWAAVEQKVYGSLLQH